jgi:hypothetical protein
VLEVKEQSRKHRKRMNNSLKQKHLDPSLVSAPYLPHFSSVLSDLKHDGCTNKGFTKGVCILEAKMQQSKNLSSKA